MHPATKANRRYEIRCIYNATNSGIDDALIDLWAKKTPAQAWQTLSKPDVTVTNEKDKGSQLPKILYFQERVKEAFDQTQTQTLAA